MLNKKCNALEANYAHELMLQNKHIQTRKAKERLAPLTPIQKTTLYHSRLSDSCIRAVEFLFNNQGARTDVISASCAIGNVSDCFIGSKGANTYKLDVLGLEVKCERVLAKNRFNRKTSIGTWWLKVVNEQKWLDAQEVAKQYMSECANDSKFHSNKGGQNYDH